MTNYHEVDEANFGQGPALWDAGEGVCCPAFQLGACEHTEAHIYDELEELEAVLVPAPTAAPPALDDEPF